MTDDEQFLKELQEGFIEEAFELVDECEQSCLVLENSDDVKPCVETLFRCFHTIKGTAASVGMQDLADYTHKVENLLVLIKNGEVNVTSDIVSIILEAVDNSKQFLIVAKEGEGSVDTDMSVVKVEDAIANPNGYAAAEAEAESDTDTDTPTALPTREESKEPSRRARTANEHIRLPLVKIDSLLDCLGEQIILQTSLNYCRENKDSNEELMDKVIVQLNKITQDLQQTAISLRMFNLSSIFKKTQRLVRDTSLQLGKSVRFSGFGEETELDKTIIDELSGPITHLVRNSVDHGIEDKEERVRCGKNECGTVELQAFQRSGYFYLVITDDGKGLDAEKIRQKALKLGLIKEDDEISDDKLHELIFHSGFSTRDAATDISGRGVGMDVVKTTIERLRGTVQVKSRIGQGSSFIIKLPLTLAVFNGMVIKVGAKRMIVPNSEIVQIINKGKECECKIDEKNTVLRDGEEVYPIVDLQRTIGLARSKERDTRKENIFLITNYGQTKYAMEIDEIIGQQKVVLKKLPEELSGLKGISGTTILGDGTVSLILDINKTLALYSQVA